MVSYPYQDIIDLSPKSCLAYRYAKRIIQKNFADKIYINPCMLSSYETGCVIGEQTRRYIEESLAKCFSEDFDDRELVIQLISRLIYLDHPNKNRLYELLFEMTHEYIITS